MYAYTLQFCRDILNEKEKQNIMQNQNIKRMEDRLSMKQRRMRIFANELIEVEIIVIHVRIA